MYALMILRFSILFVRNLKSESLQIILVWWALSGLWWCIEFLVLLIKSLSDLRELVLLGTRLAHVWASSVSENCPLSYSKHIFVIKNLVCEKRIKKFPFICRTSSAFVLTEVKRILFKRLKRRKIWNSCRFWGCIW